MVRSNTLYIASLVVLFIVAIALSILPIKFGSSPDIQMYLMKMYDADFAYGGVDFFRPAFIGFGAFIYLFVDDFFLGAHIVQAALLACILIIGLLFIYRQKLDFVSSLLVLAGLWFACVHDPRLFRPLIDFFVLLTSLAVLFIFSSPIEKKLAGWRSWTGYFVGSIAISVIVWMSKPLPVFILGGFALFWIIQLLASLRLNEEVHIRNVWNYEAKNFVIVLFSMATILVLHLIFPTEKAVEKVSSNLFAVNSGLMSLLKAWWGYLLTFFTEDKWIKTIWGGYLMFWGPFVACAFYAFRSRKALLVCCIFVAHIPMFLVLGATGLRAYQAVTLYAVWLFAVFILFSAVIDYLKKSRKYLPPFVSMVAIAIFVPLVYSEMSTRFGSSLQLDVIKTEQLKRVLNTMDGSDRLFVDANWLLTYKLAKRFVEGSVPLGKWLGGGRFSVHSKSIKIHAGEILIHRWCNRPGKKTDSQYLRLVYKRNPGGKINYFKLNVNEANIQVGDVFHLHKRWYDVRKLLEMHFELENIGKSYYRVRKILIPMSNRCFVHKAFDVMRKKGLVQIDSYEPCEVFDF